MLYSSFAWHLLTHRCNITLRYFQCSDNSTSLLSSQSDSGEYSAVTQGITEDTQKKIPVYISAASKEQEPKQSQFSIKSDQTQPCIWWTGKNSLHCYLICTHPNAGMIHSWEQQLWIHLITWLKNRHRNTLREVGYNRVLKKYPYHCFWFPLLELLPEGSSAEAWKQPGHQPHHTLHLVRLCGKNTHTHTHISCPCDKNNILLLC